MKAKANQLATELLFARDAKGLNLKAVSEATGLDFTLISKFERGTRIPNRENVEVLARYYGVDTQVWLTLRLSAYLLYELADEDETNALEALKLAEEQIKYGKNTDNK